MTTEPVQSHPSLYPLRFVDETWCCGGCAETLTNEIARDGLVLFGMIAQVRYGGKYIELDLICDGKSGLVELGRHYRG